MPVCLAFCETNATGGYCSPNGTGFPENTHQETTTRVAAVIIKILRAPAGNGLSNFSGALNARSIEKSHVHQKRTSRKDANASRNTKKKQAGQRMAIVTPSSAERGALPRFAIMTPKSDQYGTAKVSAATKNSFSYLAP